MTYKKSTLVDDYILAAPADRQEMLEAVRRLIFETAPGAEEGIGQRMPSYKLGGKQLAYFLSGKNHIGFFVDSKIVAAHAQELADYETCNSGFQLKLDEPLPTDLMRTILLEKIAQIMQSDRRGRKDK